MSSDLINGLNDFREILMDKPNALVITHSDKSNLLLSLVGASYKKSIIIDNLNDFYYLLYDKNMKDYSQIYFFLTNSEYIELIDENSPLYNLLNLSEVVFKNSEISVFNLQKLSPPLKEGSINLISDISNMNYEDIQDFLSVLLSKANLNYSINLKNKNNKT